jgi:predicted nucleotidyltransferase
MSPDQSITDAIVRAVKRHAPFRHYRVFYFGSRAAGHATARSDFDVGLEADQTIPLEVIAKIREEVDTIPILQTIDLVDFAGVSEEFAREAKRAVRLIYEQ